MTPVAWLPVVWVPVVWVPVVWVPEAWLPVVWLEGLELLDERGGYLGDKGGLSLVVANLVADDDQGLEQAHKLHPRQQVLLGTTGGVNIELQKGK